MSLTIEISTEQFEDLRRIAEAAGESVDHCVRREIEAMIERRRSFREAADYVLQKNADLYRRLAR